MSKKTLADIFHEKAIVAENIARDSALQAIIGKPENKQDEERQAKEWIIRANVWKSAIQVAKDFNEDETAPRPAQEAGE